MTDTITVPVEPKKEWRIVNDDWGYAMLLERDDGLIVHLNPGTVSNTTGVPALLADLAAAPRPDDELARLEREIAERTSRAEIFYCATYGTWYDTTKTASSLLDQVQQASRYLELRGLLERHPDHPEWVRMKEQSENG